jgi:MFS family permease
VTGVPTGASIGRRAVWGVLFRRDFGLYWLGNIVSNCGTWFQAIAATLLIYRLTGSQFLVGLVNFAQLIGIVVLSPLTGAAADRFDRRRLIMVVQVLQALTVAGMATLAALGRLDVPLLIGGSFVSGAIGAFSLTAQPALVPSLVPPEDLSSAIAMNSVTFNLARAIGPVLGAVVVVAFGFAPAFALNALSYLALAGALLVIHPRPSAARPFTERTTLGGGVQALRERPLLLGLLLAVACIAISTDPVSTLAPFLAAGVFGQPDTAAGTLIGAFGFGAVVAAFVVPHGSRSFRRIAFEMAAMGVGITVLGLVTSFQLGLVALFLAGAGYLSAQTALTTRLVGATPDHLRGRIMAFWAIAWLGVRPLASLVDGTVAQALGPRLAAIVMAVPVLVGAAAIAVWASRGREPPEADVDVQT